MDSSTSSTSSSRTNEKRKQAKELRERIASNHNLMKECENKMNSMMISSPPPSSSSNRASDEKRQQECKERIKFAQDLLRTYDNRLRMLKTRKDVSPEFIQYANLNRLKATHTIKMNEELLKYGFLRPETTRLNDEIITKLTSHPLYAKK